MEHPPPPRVGLIAIVKNEAPYLVEWLAHHRLIGIDRFYLANNDSTDGTTELLTALHRAGLVSHHPYPSVPGSRPQVPALSMLLERHRDDAEWLALIDADEFIWPMSNDWSLPRFVQRFEQQHPEVGAIALNWATYGSAGQAVFEDELVTKRFTWHAPHHDVINRGIKTLARTRAVSSVLTSHNVALHPGAQYLHTQGAPRTFSPDLFPANTALAQCLSHAIQWDHFRVNHYIVKSYQEFIQKKQARGRAMTSTPLDDVFFLGHDKGGTQTCPDPRYLQALEAEMLRIRAATPEVDHAQWTRELLTQRRSFQDQTPAPHVGCVDHIRTDPASVLLTGWLLVHGDHPVTRLELSVDQTEWVPSHTLHAQARPDVAQHFSQAPHDCGFIASFRLAAPMSQTSAIAARAVLADGRWTRPIELGRYARKDL